MRSRLKIIAGPKIQRICTLPFPVETQDGHAELSECGEGEAAAFSEEKRNRDAGTLKLTKSSVLYTNLFALGCIRFHLFRPQGMDTKARKSRSRPFQSELAP